MFCIGRHAHGDQYKATDFLVSEGWLRVIPYERPKAKARQRPSGRH